MKRLFPVLILIILLSSCRKSESDSVWEKSYGKGEAFFVREYLDSGIVAGGAVDNKPYLLRLDRKKRLRVEISSEDPGLFSSVWFDTSGYVAGGNSDGKMMLMHYSVAGNMLWEKTFESGFRVDHTNMLYEGDGNLIALGTISPEASEPGETGLLFVRFDTTGQILNEHVVSDNNFVSANSFAVDNSGSIYLALTRKATGSKSKASVAKYNNLFQKLWETELYNNPAFGATCNAIILGGDGNVYVSGATELSDEDGVLNNSYVVSLTGNGSVIWKKYLENSNSGVALSFNENEEILLLHRNCFIVNSISPTDGSVIARIRFFSICDPYNTDAIGRDMVIGYDKNYLVAGSKGENFYVALKSPQ